MKVTKEKWSDDPDNDLWQKNDDGTFLRGKDGKKIPISFQDDLNKLKDKLASFGRETKNSIANFLFGPMVATSVAEEVEPLTGDENWVPQDKEAVLEKAKALREQIDTLMEYVAALQIYCAEHTDDRETTGCVRSIEDSIQQAIDATDCLAKGNCYCKCDEPCMNDDKETEIEVADDEPVEGGSDETVEVTESDEEDRVSQISVDVIVHGEADDDDILHAVENALVDMDVEVVGGPDFTDASWSKEEYGL